MGLVALQLKDWIEADEYFYDELKEKKQLLISNTQKFLPAVLAVCQHKQKS